MISTTPTVKVQAATPGPTAGFIYRNWRRYCFNRLVLSCKERNIAVQTIKSLARRPWGEKEKTKVTWYEPLEYQQDIDRAVHWVLGNPDVFLISSSDVTLLPRILDGAKRFIERPSNEEMEEMVGGEDMAFIFKGMSMVK